MSLLLVLLLSNVLTACKPSLTRPETAPTPPSVPCLSEPLSPVPQIPDWPEIDQWAATMMGLYEIAATRLNATNNCLRDLRAKGVIR